MLAHDRHLSLVERAWLLQDGHRNLRLADVVQHGGEGEPVAVVHRQSQMSGKRDRGARHQQAMLIGLVVMPSHGVDPGREALRLDLVHDRGSRRFDPGGLDRFPKRHGGEHALQTAGRFRGARAFRGGEFRRWRCSTVALRHLGRVLAQQRATVDRAMHDVGGADGEGAGGFDPGIGVGHEDHLAVLGPRLDPLLETEQLARVLQSGRDQSEMVWLGFRNPREANAANLDKIRHLPAQTFGIGL